MQSKSVSNVFFDLVVSSSTKKKIFCKDECKLHQLLTMQGMPMGVRGGTFKKDMEEEVLYTKAVVIITN
jgi:hypothetical protein